MIDRYYVELAISSLNKAASNLSDAKKYLARANEPEMSEQLSKTWSAINNRIREFNDYLISEPHEKVQP